MDAAPRGVWWYRFAILLAPVLVLWRQDNPLFTPPAPWLRAKPERTRSP
jgi:hypothetical protein